jgi:nucleoside-diphosphate-sugar epimerase
MRILVTGANGFIGRVLLDRLEAAGLEIRAAVRRTINLPCAVFNVGDVDGSTDWRRALQGVDVVVHLAGCAYVPRYVAPPLARRKFMTVNAEGTESLARQALASGARHFIFISSVGAVSEGSKERISAATPCAPQTYYGVSKLEAERALRRVADRSSMHWTVLRPPLVYGASNPGNIARLFKLVHSGLPLPLASVQNRRSFVYVDNLADVILRCLGSPVAAAKIYYPSDDEEVSTPQLIGLIAGAHERFQCEAGGQGPGRGAVPARLFAFPENALRAMGQLPGLGALKKLTASLYVDGKTLRQELGWKPPFTMQQGLLRTLAG